MHAIDCDLDEGERDPDEKESNNLVASDTNIISRMVLNDNKAGMKGLDKEKINRIIHENSVGSKFYENERKKDAQVDVRIKKLLEQVEALTPDQKNMALKETNAILNELECTRDLSRTLVHIDMDAFYASVEERENPDLKNKPMAVGGMGMLSTSNYAARRFGVRAGMPGFIGKKLCPELILVPCNFAKYREISHQVRSILADYDPNFLPMGLDEAYLDITDHLETRKLTSEIDRTFLKIENEEDKDEKVIFGITVEDAVNEMRFRIQKETRLTASAGIAPNTLLSKVASDMNKPNGQFYLEPTKDGVMKFIRNLPIRKVSGIGKVSEKMLNALDIKTCQDIYDQRALIYIAFSQTMSSYLLRICMGIGSTILEHSSEQKSISTERTFRDISNLQKMFEKCEELCDALEEDTKKANMKGLTVTLKIKTSSFKLHTRSKTLFHPVRCKSETYPVISDLLKQELNANKGKLELRLIGVGISKLSKMGNEAQQKSLDYFMQKVVPTKEKAESASTEIVAGPIVNEIMQPINDQMDILETNCSGDTNTEEKKDIAMQAPVSDNETTPNIERSKETLEEFSCPICGSVFKDLHSLNSHLDECAITQEDEIGTSTNNNVEPKYDNNNLNLLEKQMSCLTCPLCNATFCSQDISLVKFNTHVDSCLNRKTVMALVKSETLIHSNNIKRSNKDCLKNCPPKKRQRKTGKPSCTLDKYFK